MVFGATAAQGTVGAKWLVLKTNGALMSESEVNEGTISVALEAETTGILHTKIAGVTVLFECTKIGFEKAFLLANGSIGESKGFVKGSKVQFSGCITKLNGVTSKACQPTAKFFESGVIRTNTGHALLVLHELVSGVRDDFVQFLPDTGETFATIEMSEECSIGEKVPIIGKLLIKDAFSALTHLTHHLIEVGPLTELWSISKTPEHIATVLGSAFASLGGAGFTLSWAGDPS
jgi:hypothetical protein